MSLWPRGFLSVTIGRKRIQTNKINSNLSSSLSQNDKVERFSYPGEAFFNVKMTRLGIDTFLHVHCLQKQINKLKIYAVAGYVVILPDTALEKVFPLQDLATIAEPQHGLESIDEDGIQRLLLRD